MYQDIPTKNFVSIKNNQINKNKLLTQVRLLKKFNSF